MSVAEAQQNGGRKQLLQQQNGSALKFRLCLPQSGPNQSLPVPAAQNICPTLSGSVLIKYLITYTLIEVVPMVMTVALLAEV